MKYKKGMSGLAKFLIVLLVVLIVIAIKWLITADCLDMTFVDYVKNVVWKSIKAVWEAIKALYKLPVA